MIKTFIKKSMAILLVMSMIFATQGMVVFAKGLEAVNKEATEQVSETVEESVKIDIDEIVENDNQLFVGKDGALKKLTVEDDKELINEEEKDNVDSINNVFASSNDRVITLDTFGKTLEEGSYYLESDVRADINKSDSLFISINGNVEIDLNGYTLSGYKGSPVIMISDGELTIKNGRVIAYDCYAIGLNERSSKIKVESGEYYTISRFSSNYYPNCISATFDTNDMIIEEGYFSNLQFEATYTQYNFEYIKIAVPTIKEGSELTKEKQVCGKDELTGKDLVANYIVTKGSAAEEEEITKEETTAEEETNKEETKETYAEIASETTAEETTNETTKETTVEETTVEETTVEDTKETEVETTIEETTAETTVESTEARVITEDDFGKTLKTGKYILDRNVTSDEGSIYTDGDVEIDLQGWTLTGNKSWYSTIEVSAGTLTIKNGEVVSKNGGYAICVCENAKAVIEDGYYYSTYDYESVFGGDKGDIKINAGSFVALPERYTLKEDIKLSETKTLHNGRTYNYTVGDIVEAEIEVKEEVNNRVITEDDFGKTLTSGSYILEKNIKSNNGSIFTEGDVVIDLNGHTLTGTKNWYSVIEVRTGTLTIKNGEIFSQNGGYAICVCEDAKVVVEDGYYYATYNYESIYGGNNTEVEIKSGCFSRLPEEYSLKDGSSLTNKWAFHNFKIYTSIIE